jgi:hypothetical protein
MLTAPLPTVNVPPLWIKSPVTETEVEAVPAVSVPL